MIGSRTNAATPSWCILVGWSLRSKVIGQEDHGLNFGATGSVAYTSRSARFRSLLSSSSNEYSDWIASTYHFVDRNGSVRVNVDEVVVLAVIQFTDDLVPNGRHLLVQHTYGKRDVSSFLIQQGKGEIGEESSSSSTTAW